MLFFTSAIIGSDIVNRLYHDYNKVLPKSYIYYSVALGCAVFYTLYCRYYYPRTGKKTPGTEKQV
jgi:hypothetical protein